MIEMNQLIQTKYTTETPAVEQMRERKRKVSPTVCVCVCDQSDHTRLVFSPSKQIPPERFLV